MERNVRGERILMRSVQVVRRRVLFMVELKCCIEKDSVYYDDVGVDG